MASPLRSFGSNQVVLGGIILPVSAMVINWSMVTGYKAKAAAISPESTRFFNSPKPRIPPTKSIRVLVRRSLISSNLSNTRLDKTVTPTSKVVVVVRAFFGVKEYQRPSRYMEKL